jgi:hypothetical protein
MDRALVSSAPSPRASVEKKLEYLYRRRAFLNNLIIYLEQYADKDGKSAAVPIPFSGRGYPAAERIAS